MSRRAGSHPWSRYDWSQYVDGGVFAFEAAVNGGDLPAMIRRWAWNRGMRTHVVRRPRRLARKSADIFFAISTCEDVEDAVTRVATSYPDVELPFMRPIRVSSSEPRLQ